MKNADDIYRIPSVVLFLIGAYDLLRGFMHTFLLKWSAANFAKFDLATVPEDQVFLLASDRKTEIPSFDKCLAMFAHHEKCVDKIQLNTLLKERFLL